MQPGDEVRNKASRLAESLVMELEPADHDPGPAGVPGHVDRHHAVSGRRVGRDDADEERRHRHVPGQGRRQELLPLLQPRDGPGGRTPRAHGAGTAWRVGARRIEPGLPAGLPAARPTPGRRRGAAALASSGAGHGRAVGIHRCRRAERPDRNHRPAGAARRLPRRGALAAANSRVGRAVVRIGQRIAAAAAQRGTAGQVDSLSARHRLAALRNCTSS